MKKYSDYQSDKTRDDLTDDELNQVKWTNYKIVVPTQEDKQEMMEAIKHFHDNHYDSDIITCNQIAHEYINGDNIIIDEELFNKLNKK